VKFLVQLAYLLLHSIYHVLSWYTLITKYKCCGLANHGPRENPVRPTRVYFCIIFMVSPSAFSFELVQDSDDAFNM